LSSSTAVTNKNIALFVVCISGFAFTIMASGLNIALPAINREFNANVILLNWVVTAQLLSSGVFMIPFGRLADIIGIKKVFFTGNIIIAVSLIAMSFSNSIFMLIGCQVIFGIGAAMTAATISALLTAVFPPEERGWALGFSVSFVYAGTSVGPLLGGFLIEHIGWRSIFFLSILIELVIIILTRWKIKQDWSGSRGEKFDYPGSIIYGLALVVLLYGFSQLPNMSGAVMSGLGVVGMFFFVFWENRTASPILDMKIFRNNKLFLFSNLTALISYSALFGVVFLLSLYLQYVKYFSPGTAGLVLMTQAVIQTVLSPLSGKLSDKFDPRIVASIGMALCFLSMIPFIFLGQNTPLALIIIALVVLGCGFSLFSSPNMNSIMSAVTPKYYSVASATTATMRTLGGLFSMGIAMVVMAMVMGKAAITQGNLPDLLSSTQICFAVFCALCLAGVFTSLARGKSTGNRVKMH
jgi:EmrB/QacA subfamily drug resistance transporter